MPIQPSWPSVGLPAGEKQAGQRVDFKPNKFDLVIETKGLRYLWERASPCACESVNDQTDQADPNCAICHGSGWEYFGPESSVIHDSLGEFDDTQTAFINAREGAVIRALVTGISQEEDPFNKKVKRWVSGMAKGTVRPANKLGYYDRLTGLDGLLVFGQRLKADGTEYLTTRYTVCYVNRLRTASEVLKAGVDYTLELGRVKWLRAMAEDTLVAIHYLTFPTWLVVDWPYAVRVTSVLKKIQSPTTPLGNPTDLVLQATLKYDFLP